MWTKFKKNKRYAKMQVQYAFQKQRKKVTMKHFEYWIHMGDESWNLLSDVRVANGKIISVNDGPTSVTSRAILITYPSNIRTCIWEYINGALQLSHHWEPLCEIICHIFCLWILCSIKPYLPNPSIPTSHPHYSHVIQRCVLANNLRPLINILYKRVLKFIHCLIYLFM